MVIRFENESETQTEYDPKVDRSVAEDLESGRQCADGSTRDFQSGNVVAILTQVRYNVSG